MSTAYLKSLNLGKIQEINGEKTAMLKIPTQKAVFCNKTGFLGDNISNKKHHGGENRAVFANSLETYIFLEKILNKSIINFGENLSIDGLNEDDVYIGDIHKIGSLTLQVSEPRKPCFMIEHIFKNNLTYKIWQSGLSGWYYRVLEEGISKINDKIFIQKQGKISIKQINKCFFNPKENINEIKNILQSNFINQNWKNTLQQRLDGNYNLDYMMKK